VDVHSIRQPLGVAAIISPFDVLAMVPMWFFPAAMAAGNTVLLKPSENDPTAASWMAELWKEAGLPDGVFNIVHGDEEAVDALLDSPEVDSVFFVGSTLIVQYVYEPGTANGNRIQALGGAENHKLVLDGRQVDPDAEGEGLFLTSTLFDHVTADMSVHTDEIFGPAFTYGARGELRPGRTLLHPRQGRDQPLAGPQPRRPQPRLPDPLLRSAS
jgi:acyl-CoA reductase-like NAD-dependent aldehyde dehydrogenase